MVRKTSNEALCVHHLLLMPSFKSNTNISASRCRSDVGPMSGRRREILAGGAVGPTSGRCRADVGPYRAGRRRKVPFSASIVHHLLLMPSFKSNTNISASRRRADVGPTSGNLSGRRRWPDVGPMSGRCRADVGPTSGHIGRADVGKYPSRLPYCRDCLKCKRGGQSSPCILLVKFSFNCEEVKEDSLMAGRRDDTVLEMVSKHS